MRRKISFISFVFVLLSMSNYTHAEETDGLYVVPRAVEKKWTSPPICGVIDCIKERKEVKSGG